MKKIFTFCFIVSFVFSAFSQEEYTLVFSDDFTNATLDAAKWNVQTGLAPNQELQYYTSNSTNLRIENGNLVIEALKEQVSNRNYTSARIHSKGKGFIKYGKAEARISLPAGAGTWPAFWMMPEVNTYGGWPLSGEIDIMEHVGSQPTMISHAVHTKIKNGSKGTNWFNKQYPGNVENNFRVYSVVWEENKMDFYIDDVKSVTLYKNPVQNWEYWPFDQNFYVILNLAIGGTMGGTVDDNIFNNPVQMKVDYVRLYQKNGVGVNSIKNDDLIEVYPTQFSNQIHIKTENSVQIKLYNLTGKLVLEKNIEKNDVLLTEYLPSGIYFLEAGEKTFKLIK